jgi:hypothetical protein
MATLEEQLFALQQCARGNRRKSSFYPPRDVQKLFTFAVIRASISSIPSLREDQLDLFASLIEEDNLITLAILLSNSHQHQILEFLFRRLNDDRIPYAEESLQFLSKVEARRFVERQWEFIPVVLTTRPIHRQIQDEEILPFLEEERVGEGGFGTVFKVKLYQSCQSLISVDVEHVRIAHG